MSKLKKCTVLVNSCDEYEDLWVPFFELFNKFWGDCPYPIVLNTEHKKFSFDNLNIRSINLETNRQVPYGERLINCLNQIDSEYIVVLLDDFFLRSKVDQVYMDSLIAILDKNDDISCLSFDCFEDKYNIDDGRIPGFNRRSKYGRYRYNLQAAIWRKDDFRNSWKKNETPWSWEAYGNMRSWINEEKIYVVNTIENCPINYGKTGKLDWGVVRGKWVEHDIVPLFSQNNIHVDYSIRGFGDLSTGEMGGKCGKLSISQMIYSIGFFSTGKYLLWRISKATYNILHKARPIENDYSDMLNKRNVN